MSKRAIGIAIAVLLVGGLAVYGGAVDQKNRSAWAAVGSPVGDVAELIDDAGTNGGASPFRLPDGFSVSLFARDLVGPRVMLWGPDGGLLVSLPKAGKVVSLRDTDGDGDAETVRTVLEGLDNPHGMTVRCTGEPTAVFPLGACTLYVAETDKVMAYAYTADGTALADVRGKKLIDLPDSGGGHSTRSLMFRPYPDDRELLVSIGSSCNVCNETDERRAAVLAVNVETGAARPFAKGLRNAVFMATHPVSGDTWATEMGRDWLGDDTPPDELNILAEGKNYGWPICYGKNIHDTDFDKNTYVRNPCMEPFETASRIDIPAHSAPLGIAFVPEEGWPQDWWYNAIVAYHGSWNRSAPTGYKLVRYRLDERGNYLGEEDFMTGFLTDRGALGRPADILIQPGGTMYVSDDTAGVIYRITYAPPKPLARPVSDLIRVTAPKANDFVSSPLTVAGEARGMWYFEASFPFELLDAKGARIAQGVATAEDEWMTENFVPFRAELRYAGTPVGVGTLVFHRDNPSGLPENDAELRLPVRFEPPSAAGGDGEEMPNCRKTGCSGQICSDKEIASTCEWSPAYACYDSAVCERQSNGACGWTMTAKLETCIAESGVYLE